MKLSKKGRYAVRALFDIAFNNEGQPTQVKDIAERQTIPARFLEQIFQDLKRAGIVASKRGPQGGYSLARLPERISLGDVVRALEGAIALAEEGATDKGPPSRRVTDAVFRDLSASIQRCFDDVSISDICTRAEELGMHRPGTQRQAYVI
ncbi:MAG TPA: Rrf2 family transcriptional regulator [Polyangiaceae bacterium]|nr:Rrf2 family transcriptional regulator [Polyangiaceae bacterium]